MRTEDVLAIGAGLALVVVVIIVLSRRQPAEEVVTPPVGEEVGLNLAGLSLTILDSSGTPVPSDSPLTLKEGASYTAVITVTNQSIADSTPVGASFAIGVGGATMYPTIWSFLDYTWTGQAFQAGQSLEFRKSFIAGPAATNASIWASVWAPTGAQIAVARLEIAIVAPVTKYLATVTVGAV